MAVISDIYARRYQTLFNRASKKPLAFRKEARIAFSALTKSDRAIIRGLDAGGLSVHEFFIQWRTTHLPRVEHINGALTNSALKKNLRDSLELDSTEAQSRIQAMVDERLREIKQSFIEEFYHPNETNARQMADDVLSREVSEIALLADRYVSYELYRDIGDSMEFTIYDAQRTFLVRGLQAAKERRQIKRFVRTTRRQISQLAKERSDTEASYDGLVSRVLSLGIDLVSVLAARQGYEKALARLSEANRSSATKRLALFEKHTSSIRTQYLDALPGASSLSEAQSVVKGIDAAVMEVFDMDTTNRNALMSQFRRYRELTRTINELETSLQQ